MVTNGRVLFNSIPTGSFFDKISPRVVVIMTYSQVTPFSEKRWYTTNLKTLIQKGSRFMVVFCSRHWCFPSTHFCEGKCVTKVSLRTRQAFTPNCRIFQAKA